MTKNFGHRTPMFTGMLACSLGQCLAGLCTTFETFIVCQGLVFGIGEIWFESPLDDID